jgi:phospholipase C
MKIDVPVRRLLATLSAVAIVSVLAAAGGHAYAASARSGSTGPSPRNTLAASRARAGLLSTPIRHIVVIYLENHSFDNVLGFWCDSHPGRCPDGGMPAKVTLSDGAVVTPFVDPDTVPPVNHSVGSQFAAMHIVNGVPRMNGWEKIPEVQKGSLNTSCDKASGYQCVSGYEPRQIPNLAKLATDFAVSDNTFSMGNSPSWGGHLYAVLASQDGFLGQVPGPKAAGPGWGCNSDKLTPWKSPQGKLEYIPSCIPDFSLNPSKYPYGGAFKPTPAKWEPSILDRLDAAGLTWKIYDGGRQPASDGWATCPSLADCWDTTEVKNMTAGAQFNVDAAKGTLPNFSLIIPGSIDEKYSQHNLVSMARGDNWIGQLATALMNGPEWSSSALFITYDDCGCFYDQGVPTHNPDGTWQGPRSPLVIVSPYARPGYTDTTHTTFAGILAYVEHTFGLPPLSPNDKAAYDFSNAFNYAQQPLRPVKMVRRPLPPSARKLRLTPALLNDPT